MKNNLNKFLLTVMHFAGMVLTTFSLLITSNLGTNVLAEKKEHFAGVKIFIKYIQAGTAYLTSVLNDERSSINNRMKLQHLFL